MDFAVPETWPGAQGGGFRWEGWEVWPGGGGAGPDPFSLSLSLQDAMRKTLDPRALALGKELGLWSTLSEAAAPHRTLPTAHSCAFSLPFPSQQPWRPPGFLLPLSALPHITNDLNLGVWLPLVWSLPEIPLLYEAPSA